MSYPASNAGIDAFARMCIVPEGRPHFKPQLLAAIAQTRWPPSVQKVMQASVTNPESCGENLYKRIWFSILSYGFPDNEAVVAPVGWKESTRRKGGDKEVDIGVSIPVETDESTMRWLPILLVELKDPDNWNTQSDRFDAHEQIQERGDHLSEKLNKDRALSDAVGDLKYIYILSVYGFNFKIYRLDTTTSLVFPVLPRAVHRRRTDEIPYQTDWKYNILRPDGFDAIIAVFHYVYERLDESGVTFAMMPQLPPSNIVLDTLTEFFPPTPTNQPIPTNYHTPPDALSALMDPLSLRSSTSSDEDDEHGSDDDDDANPARRRNKTEAADARQWNGYKGKHTASFAQSPVAARTRGQQSLPAPGPYAATPASFLEASPRGARGSSQMGHWQESPETDPSGGRYLAGMGGILHAPNEAALKRTFARFHQSRTNSSDGSPEHRRGGSSRK